MKIELPIFVETLPNPRAEGVLFHLRPLFFDEPRVQHRELSRATGQLIGEMSKELNHQVKWGELQALADYTFCPEAKLHRTKFRMDLRHRTFHGRFPVVTFRQFDRQMAFTPHLLDLWFEIPRGDPVEARAREVYTQYFRDLERDEGKDEVERALRPFIPRGRAWIDVVEFGISTRQKRVRPSLRQLADLFASDEMDGDVELDKVGRCLDRLYPDELRRATFRGPALQRLHDCLGSTDHRPVMIVGPPSVGKTTLIHEFVYRRVEKRTQRHASSQNVWLLAPQRLISGMKYVGQWEERLLAILKTARRRSHILYFDDVLGLFRAGRTNNSNLAVANVLKPYVDRGDVRLLTEMTPESLRVFRERDRGFADLFQIVTLEEPGPRRTLRMLLASMRQLEARHDTQFDVDVLPTVTALTRRYQRDRAFPGKAADVLGDLAVKGHGRQITRDVTLEQYRAKTGLDLILLDNRTTLKRSDVLTALGGEVLGQPAALNAMADVVCIAKARLNDAERPLGSLLFLGPTGVGKTQSAKALTRYLFGHADRLLRYDMNEYVSPGSVARLAGTFDSPEGLLTSAVRQQPYAVVLFDEIEKAHPDVFDLLLQILGEARLTDALGRTVDFSSAVILLTSNLGTREASHELGFKTQERTQPSVYLKAVRDFFRPEFFNRLDRIVPFESLGRDELRRIARRVLAEVLEREGFSRRRCAVDLAGSAMQWVIQQGYHPSLGARAMKRAVEDHVVRPLARKLARVTPEMPIVIELRRRDDQLHTQVHTLTQAETPAAAPHELLDDPQRLVQRGHRVLDRIDTQCEPLRPIDGISAGNIVGQNYWYLAVTEFSKGLRKQLRQLRDELEQEATRNRPPAIAPKRPTDRMAIERRRYTCPKHGLNCVKELCAAEDVHRYLNELYAEHAAPATDDSPPRWFALIESLAYLQMLQPDDTGWQLEQTMVVVRSLSRDFGERRAVVADLLQAFRRSTDTDEERFETDLGLESRHLKNDRKQDTDAVWWEALADESLRRRYRQQHQIDVLAFEGPRAHRWVSTCEGTYLFTNSQGRLVPVQVMVLPVADGATVETTLTEFLASREQDHPAPFPWKSIVALFAPASPAAAPKRAAPREPDTELYRLVMDLRPPLPLPPELEE